MLTRVFSFESCTTGCFFTDCLTFFNGGVCVENIAITFECNMSLMSLTILTPGHRTLAMGRLALDMQLLFLNLESQQNTRGAVSHTIPFLNSIAFGSAPRREADSQHISQLARPAVSQSNRNTQFGFFVSGKLGPKQLGGSGPARQMVAEW